MLSLNHFLSYPCFSFCNGFISIKTLKKSCTFMLQRQGMNCNGFQTEKRRYLPRCWFYKGVKFSFYKLFNIFIPKKLGKKLFQKTRYNTLVFVFFFCLYILSGSKFGIVEENQICLEKNNLKKISFTIFPLKEQTN